jgi:4-hydroxybenzoate polyprenyltransferase
MCRKAELNGRILLPVPKCSNGLMNKVLAWSRLMRLSNLPTAWSNILMGLVVSAGNWDFRSVIVLLTVSTCLYLGGMVLNDVCDIEVDRLERPQRVLPSGLISRRSASAVGHILLLTGPLIAGLATLTVGKDGVLHLATPACGTALALALVIVAYNYGGKSLWFGPVLMGLCRILNVLLGTSLAESDPSFLGHGILYWYIATAIGIFVAGITWFARDEEGNSARASLIAGTLLMAVALMALLILPFGQLAGMKEVRMPGTTPDRIGWAYCGMLVMLLLPAIRRVVLAIGTPDSARVQRAVVACLQSLIMIDAAICFLFAPTVPLYAIVVALLIVPRTLLGRSIAST